MGSDFFKHVTDMYNEMGDSISLQYGGSIAHHSQLQKKKSFFASLTEVGTSIKRHYANNFSDPQRQNVINLFLGIYQPMKNRSHIWNLPDNESQTQLDVLAIQKKQGDFLLQNPLPMNWWQRPFRGFEAKLPV